MENLKWRLYNPYNLNNNYIITMLKSGFYYEHTNNNKNIKWQLMILSDKDNLSEYYIHSSKFNNIIEDIKNNIYENNLKEKDIFL
ncbi:MAG: hypothetical protein PHX70_14395 [Clostridium sp.]|nr:hypothetical protein [Clostridium sp.]